MNDTWVQILDHRRACLRHLTMARKEAILAGDRPVADYLFGAINRQNERVRYAHRMAGREGSFFTRSSAQFATAVNAANNGRSTGANNGR